MGMLHNETHLWPTNDATLSEQALTALVSELVKSRVVRGPYAVVTSARLPAPFSRYSPLGDTLFGVKQPPADLDVVFRGDSPDALVAALSRERDTVVYFADVRPFFEDIPPERAYPVLLYAFAEPRDVEVNAPSGVSTYRARTAVVVLGTTIESPKYHPVRDIVAVLEKHLGPIEQQYDILH